MTLTVETGVGVQGAESYAAVAFIDAYWAGRTHSPLAAIWADAGNTTAKKEGAAREATAYIDATWGAYYRGLRRGYVQGLLFPRSDALDDAGFPLPDLPAELPAAVAELAARAASAVLAKDIDAGGRVKRERVGPIETEYFDAGTPAPGTSYGSVAAMLAPILNGRQPDAPSSHWLWA